MSTKANIASAPASASLDLSLFPVRCTIPHRRVSLSSFGPGRTKQSMKAECDINNILAKFQRTGAISHLNKHSAQYGYAPSEDFREALEIVQHGSKLFGGLPSSLRKRFNNDPAEFLDFVQDPANLAEARQLGLARPAEPGTPGESRAAPEPPPSA